MNRLLLLILMVLPTAGAAQGVVKGKVSDIGGSEYLEEEAVAGVVALPDSAPPFNEITSTEWQDAFNALAAGDEPTSPLGGRLASVEPESFHTGEVFGDGTFEVADAPLGKRLGVAVRVGEVWWPLREEIKLTEDSPAAEVEVPYFRLGADPDNLEIATHTLVIDADVRGDFTFAPVQFSERLRIANPDPDRGAVAHVSLQIAVPPTINAETLTMMYGSLIVYMQGWNAAPPVERPEGGAAVQPWSFGKGGGMHGSAGFSSNEPQASADNWHPLNTDPMLSMAGAGDTSFVIEASPGGRSARLEFLRPVPPNGFLDIRVRHTGGMLMSNPEGRIALERSFRYPVREATASTKDGLELTALVEGAHRKLYGEAERGNRIEFPAGPVDGVSLPAGETAQIVLGFGEELQALVEEVEQRAAGQPSQSQSGEGGDEEARGLNQQTLFKALAVFFGLAFVAAFVATIRKPREKQLETLGELPGSRADVLEALREMKADFDSGKLPARAYQEQRQRLLNRLVEFDAAARQGDAGD